MRISIKMKNYYFSNGKINISIVEDIQFTNKNNYRYFVKEGPTFYITNFTISGLNDKKKIYRKRN